MNRVVSSRFAWMSSVQYLAQVAHFFGALSVMLVYGIFTREWHMIDAFMLGTAIAVAKEFVFDVAPWGEGDSWSDSALDFTFYLLGGALGAELSHLAFIYHCCG
jgi:hypothetical protein